MDVNKFYNNSQFYGDNLIMDALRQSCYSEKYKEYVRILITKGVDLNLKNKKGDSIVDILFNESLKFNEKYTLEIAELLLKHRTSDDEVPKLISKTLDFISDFKAEKIKRLGIEENIFSKIMLNEENSINNFEKYNIPPDMVHTIMENRLTQISKSLGKEASSNKKEKHVHFKKDQNRDLL